MANKPVKILNTLTTDISHCSFDLQEPLRHMKRYLDENITNRRVVAHLHRMGHTVVLPAEVGHAGASDTQHFAATISQAGVLLTQNYRTSSAYTI